MLESEQKMLIINTYSDKSKEELIEKIIELEKRIYSLEFFIETLKGR